MSLSALHNLRRALVIMIVMMFASLSAFAQTAAEETPQPSVAVDAVEDSAEETPVLEAAPSSEIDLSDPALMEALVS